MGRIVASITGWSQVLGILNRERLPCERTQTPRDPRKHHPMRESSRFSRWAYTEPPMRLVLALLVWFLRATSKSQADLVFDNLALRQQLAICARAEKRPRLKPLERKFWV